jgi:hypothetical protein
MITINEAEEILKKEYHRDNFLCLLNDILLPDYEKDERNVIFNNTVFNNVIQLGTSQKCDIVVFEVSLKENVQNRRVAITQEMFRVLRGQRINNALVAFNNSDGRNYRISLLISKYEFDGEKIKKIISNPRRYSYYLGYGTKTNTTFKYLIQKGKVNSIDELTGRFSVEVVNNEFYNEIAIRFTELVGGERKEKTYKRQLKIYGETNQDKYSEFTVRLIGRIVFCWFLKEKKSKNNIPLVPDDLLSIQAIKEDDTYYHAVLEPLFFEILNTEQKKRKDKFGKDEIYKKIPYLNGGLFSQHNDDHYEYSEATESGIFGIVTISDKWFKDLFSVFERYNFTVDENTTYDVELSIDPEMLGRIFENLLAEINPETKESLKKNTGSYYTPREIVEYMVDNSLYEYLQNKTGIEGNKLKNVINYSKDDEIDALSEAEKKKIIDALYSLTILDPACGSGAFPIGMLQKIVYLLQEIDPDAELWFDKAIDNILIRKEIQKKFSIGALDFIRKLSVIQKSIFGVDIQPIAVEIARLRCFLSLIIEEKVDDNEENRSINPLPNLDFKFVIADTLIKLENGLQHDFFEDKSHIEGLKAIRNEYFNSSKERRETLKLEFTNIQKEMLKKMVSHKATSSRYQNLLDWKPFENASTRWFDPEWMFGVKDGFDIIIGNPPYLKEGKISKKIFSKYKNSSYYQGKMDLWYMFACIGIDLLKNHGLLCFIATNNWVTNSGSSKFRNKIIQDSIIKQFIDFGNLMVFDASIQTMIMLFSKNSVTDNYCFDYRKLTGDTKLFDALDLMNKKSNNKATYLSPVIVRKNLKNSFLTFSSNDIILGKIAEEGIYLKEKEIAQGIVFPQDFLNKKNQEILGNDFTTGEGIFVLSKKEKDNLKLSKNELKLIKPYYTTKQIHRYYSDPINKLWLIYTDSRYKKPHSMDNYQKLKDHLDRFANIITSDNKPYGLHRARKEKFFNGEKIIVQRKCVYHPSFSYSDFTCYVSATFYVIKTSRFNLKYLLGLLNSKLIAFWLKNKGKMQGDNYQLDKEPLLQIPIINTSIEYQQPIISLVDKILSTKNKNPLADITDFEKEIDGLIYELYGLSEEEVKIVEGKT